MPLSFLWPGRVGGDQPTKWGRDSWLLASEFSILVGLTIDGARPRSCVYYLVMCQDTD